MEWSWRGQGGRRGRGEWDGGEGMGGGRGKGEENVTAKNVGSSYRPVKKINNTTLNSLARL